MIRFIQGNFNFHGKYDEDFSLIGISAVITFEAVTTSYSECEVYGALTAVSRKNMSETDVMELS